MNKKRFLLILFVLVFLNIFFISLSSILGGVGGNFGIRPKTHLCIGITISNKTALENFPKGDFTFSFLGKGYEYRVNEERMLRDMCIGQDVWYGE